MTPVPAGSGVRRSAVATVASLIAALVAALAGAAAATEAERYAADVTQCVPTTDGAAVQLRRCLGGAQGGTRSMLDPFLVLDAYAATRRGEFAGGFPAHPHRGFTEVRYLLAGSLSHEDSCGTRAVTSAGGLQLFFTGRGVAHEEMPTAQPAGVPPPGPGADPAWLFAGFQLWLALPAARHGEAPGYANWPDAACPRHAVPAPRDPLGPPGFVPPPGAVVKVLAGRFGGREGPLTPNATGLLWLDVERLAPGARPLELPAATADHALLYVYRGSVSVGSEAAAALGRVVVVDAGEFTPLTPGPVVVLAAAAGADGAARPAAFLFLTAPRVREPVFVAQGFAAASRGELDAAVRDFSEGRASKC